MKKIIAALVAAAAATTALMTMPMTHAAADDDTEYIDNTYTMRFELERNTVSAEEIAAGDVVIPAKVYISGSTKNTVTIAQSKFKSDNYHVYFTDLQTGNNTLDENVTYESSQGEFTTNYLPFCFASLKNGRYQLGSCMFTTNAYAFDRISGSNIYSAGYSKITFSYSDRSSGTSQNITEVCDVDVDEDNVGTYTYNHINQSTYVAEEYKGTLNHYDPDTPEGDMVRGDCDVVQWCTTSTSGLTNGVSFFGETSDEFPFCYVNVVLEQGLESGVYHIDFDDSLCSILNANNQYYNLDYQGTSIAVGINDITITQATMDDVALYASYDTHPIVATDFASEILATVVYDNGDGTSTIEENVDITELVDFNGVTPEDLYTQLATNGYYSSKNAPLYYNGKILTYADGTQLTEKIMVGMKGDVDYDGKVTAIDAHLILVYYANSQVSVTREATFGTGNTSDKNMEDLTYFLADTTTCSKIQGADGGFISAIDAHNVLLYYASEQVNQHLAWDSFRE